MNIDWSRGLTAWLMAVCLGLAVGCEEPAADAPAVEAETSESPTEESEEIAQAEEPAEAEVTDESEATNEDEASAEELPIPEDFEEEVASSIAADSYAAALDALEAELDADGDDAE